LLDKKRERKKMLNAEAQAQELRKQFEALMAPKPTALTLKDGIIHQMEMELRNDVGVFNFAKRRRPATQKAKRRQVRSSKRLSKLPYKPKDRVATGLSKSYHDWIVLRAKETPGPDAYDNRYPVDSDVLPSMNLFGKFSEHPNPSALDVLCLAKSREPGPMDYEPNFDACLSRPPSACFTEGKQPTVDDLYMQQAAISPGPGQYPNAYPPYSPLGSGKFSLASADGPVDVAVKRAARTPGPGQYDVATSERSLSPIRGGRFATAFLRKSERLQQPKHRLSKRLSTQSEGGSIRGGCRGRPFTSSAGHRGRQQLLRLYMSDSQTIDDGSTLTTLLSPTSIVTEPNFVG
jgi:hypothetical protein